MNEEQKHFVESMKPLIAVLHTGGKTAEQLKAEYDDVTDEETAVYQKIFEVMDGKKAILMRSYFKNDIFDFLAMEDPKEDREIAYLMEQDPMFGCFIDDREEFDRVYDSGEYCRDAIFTLKKEQVEIIENLASKEDTKNG